MGLKETGTWNGATGWPRGCHPAGSIHHSIPREKGARYKEGLSVN